jgi:DNA topoisomerase-1
VTEHFTQYVDYDFTARLEDELDAVARGEKDWVPVMEDFWKPFKRLVEDKETSVSRSDVTTEAMDEACPKCGKPLNIRLGRRGRFIGCSGYPECDYTRNVDDERGSSEPEKVEGRSCPECKSDLIIRSGRYGKFIGCSSYPECKYIEPLEKPADTGVQCPQCKQGNLLKRKSRRGKIFYSCSRYPDCEYAIWNEPLATPCPECHWPITSIKTTKRSGTQRVCPQQDCKFAEPWDEPVAETAEQA